MSGLSFEALQHGFQVAEDALRSGRYREAMDGFSGLLQARLAAGSENLAAADLMVVERLSEIAALFGLSKAAENLLDGMAALMRQSGNALGADYTDMKRVELALSAGDLHGAMTRLECMRDRIGRLQDIVITPEGLAHWEGSLPWQEFPAGDRFVLLTRIYLALGRVLSGLGQYADSIRMLERGLAHAADARADLVGQTRVPLRLARATALLELGEFTRADSELVSLGALKEVAALPAAWVRHQELSGKLNMLRGRFGLAVDAFRQVLAFCSSGGLEQAAAIAGLNLAHVLILVNRVSEAIRLIQPALAFATSHQDERLFLRATMLTTVARGRRHSRVAALSSALSVTEMLRPTRHLEQRSDGPPPQPPPTCRQSADFLSFFEDRSLEVHWALGVGDVTEAQRRLATMEAVFRSSDSRLIHARLAALEGLVAFHREAFGTAVAEFDRAQPLLAAVDLRPELWQVLDLRSRCNDRLGRRADMESDVERANALLSTLANSLDGAPRAIYLLNKATTEEYFISVQIERLIAADRRASRASWFSRPWRRWQVMRQLDAVMRHVDRYRSTVANRQLLSQPAGLGPMRISSAALVRRLFGIRRDHAALSFLVLPDQVLLTWTARLKVGFAIAPVTRVALREQVRHWHEQMHREGKARDLGSVVDTQSFHDPPEDRDLAADLATKFRLEAVLGALPPQVTSLAIQADDVLHGVPFGALRHDGRYLTERYALSISSSAGRRPRAATTPPARGVVIAVSRGFRRAPPLPNAIPEARSVSGVLRSLGLRVDRLFDDDASREAILRTLQDSDVAHIVCHGVFEPDRPDFSGMLTVPNPGQAERVTLRDLAMLHLDRCAHVTLSSCWSADNFILPGRWVVSMPQTLCDAGVGSVLASLWPVDDDVAGTFMARFYRALETMSRDQALRRVKLDCLEGKLNCRRGSDGTLIDTADPFFWAGFNLYGTGGALRFNGTAS